MQGAGLDGFAFRDGEERLDVFLQKDSVFFIQNRRKRSNLLEFSFEQGEHALGEECAVVTVQYGVLGAAWLCREHLAHAVNETVCHFFGVNLKAAVTDGLFNFAHLGAIDDG